MAEIVEELLKALLEILFRVVLRAPGGLIVRLFRGDSDEPLDGCLIVVCSVVFWLIAGLAVWVCLSWL